MSSCTNRTVAGLLMAAVPILAGCQDRPKKTAAVATYKIEGARTKAEQGEVSNLVLESQHTLTSEAFRQNLLALRRRYPTVFVRRGRPDLPLERVAIDVSGQLTSARYLPARLVLNGSDDPDSADYQHAGSGRPLHLGSSVRIRLGRGILADFHGADIVQKSCAINTVAHELTHTISLTPIIFTRAFEDTRRGEAEVAGRSDPHSAVGSYLIGAVAQCTWLADKGRIPDWSVADCVEVFGARSFNWRRCTAFSDGGPVRLQPGLPKPNASL